MNFPLNDDICNAHASYLNRSCNLKCGNYHLIASNSNCASSFLIGRRKGKEEGEEG